MSERIVHWQVDTAQDKSHYAASVIKFGEYDWERKMGTVYAKGSSLSEVIDIMASKGYDYHPVDGFSLSCH